MAKEGEPKNGDPPANDPPSEDKHAQEIAEWREALKTAQERIEHLTASISTLEAKLDDVTKPEQAKKIEDRLAALEASLKSANDSLAELKAQKPQPEALPSKPNADDQKNQKPPFKRQPERHWI